MIDSFSEQSSHWGTKAHFGGFSGGDWRFLHFLNSLFHTDMSCLAVNHFLRECWPYWDFTFLQWWSPSFFTVYGLFWRSLVLIDTKYAKKIRRIKLKMRQNTT